MPRPTRYELAGVPQHVVQRGNNRQRTFFDTGGRLRYLRWLRDAAVEYPCEVHAYVLMTNHVHLLMTPLEPMAIAGLMQSLGRRYVRYVNDRRARTGTLWEGRYKASLVATDSYLMACHRYIELNPVRAGIVRDPSRFRWSSFGHNALGRPDPLITGHPVYLALGADPASRTRAYQELFETDLSADEIARIRGDLNRCAESGEN